MSSDVAPASGEHHLTAFQKTAYACGNFAVGLVPAPVAGGMLLYFWTGEDAGKTIVYAGVAAFALVQLFGRLQDALADPIVGYLSDRVHTRFGRRMPWILAGTPVMLGAFVALWYPPTTDSSFANVVLLALAMAAFWWGFTMIFAPYLSLLPEIETGIKERIRLSERMAYFEVAGTIAGMVGVGQIIDRANGAHFAAMPEAVRPEWGSFDPHGYHVMAWSIAILGLLSLLPVLLFVREKGAEAGKMVPYRFREAAAICVRNRPFRTYVISDGLFKFGFWLVVAAIVFIVKVILHQSEGLAGLLGALPVLFAALLFWPVSRLSERYGKRRVFLWGLMGFAIGLPMLGTVAHFPFLGAIIGPGLAEMLGARVVEGTEDLTRTSHAVGVILLLCPSIAVLYVLPRAILADIMDADAAATGYRREAMYNGMWAIVEKTAIGLSGMALAGLAILDQDSDGGLLASLKAFFTSTETVALGPNALTAVGPLAGVFVLWAWWVFRRYPIED